MIIILNDIIFYGEKGRNRNIPTSKLTVKAYVDSRQRRHAIKYELTFSCTSESTK